MPSQERQQVNDPIQQHADALAARLRRGVAIDDAEFRLLAHSAHDDNVDAVRRSGILHRRASPETIAWVKSWDVERAQGPVRVPRNPEMEMLARLGIAVRYQGTLLGYVWMIDEPTPLDEDDLAAIEQCAQQVGALIYEQRLLGGARAERQRVALERLLGGDAAAAREAVAQLEEMGVPTAVRVRALVVGLVLPEAGPRDRAMLLRTVVERLGRVVDLRETIAACAEDDEPSVTIVAPADAGDARPLAERVAALVLEVAADATARAAIGLGPVVDDVAATRASWERARIAAALARRADRPDALAWEDLGALRIVEGLRRGLDPQTLVPPLVTQLAGEQRGLVLLETLRAFLDCGGDAATAAGRLFVHRTTLYQRLARIEALGGVSLADGEVRLELHLGLRLLDLVEGGA